MKTIQFTVTLGDDALQSIVELLGQVLSQTRQRSTDDERREARLHASINPPCFSKV